LGIATRDRRRKGQQRLYRREGRHHQPDPDNGARFRHGWNPRQCDCAGCHRHADAAAQFCPSRRSRASARSLAQPPCHETVRQGGGGGRGRAPSRQRCVFLYDRHRDGGRWRLARGMNSALIALEAQVRADLAKTAHPNAAWLTPRLGPDGGPALDVLVVGAGQSGLATAFGLMRSQVSNILVLDKSKEGLEGPWLTYARMHTLRSPKHFTGPDLDIPSLTYQSWHEARFGEEDWRNLDLISRELWAEYLLWFRRIVDVPVRNGCEVVEISPASNGLLAAKVKTADGVNTLFARKIVLATGQEGMGDWTIPEPLRHLPPSVCTHAAQP